MFGTNIARPVTERGHSRLDLLCRLCLYLRQTEQVFVVGLLYRFGGIEPSVDVNSSS